MMACQHQDAAANPDCDAEAVLCEAHGGHDGCAVEIMHLRDLLREVAHSGVELEDPRIGYVTVQMDRETWLEIQKLMEDDLGAGAIGHAHER